jgi:hypothetical protein
MAGRTSLELLLPLLLCVLLVLLLLMLRRGGGLGSGIPSFRRICEKTGSEPETVMSGTESTVILLALLVFFSLIVIFSESPWVSSVSELICSAPPPSAEALWLPFSLSSSVLNSKSKLVFS